MDVNEIERTLREFMQVVHHYTAPGEDMERAMRTISLAADVLSSIRRSVTRAAIFSYTDGQHT